MQVALKLFLCLSLTLGTAWAAQDHNSSRSNKSGIVAGDLSDQSGDFSKEISLAGTEDYTKGSDEIMSDVSDMEVRVAYLRARMTIGIFSNFLLQEVQALRCKSFEDKACVDQAIQNAEALTMKKARHDIALNAIRNMK